MKNQEPTHFHHVMLMAEYGMTMSLHFLPEYHLSSLAQWLGISFFAIYSIVSLFHYRQTTRRGNI